jgi:hypothetical protein
LNLPWLHHLCKRILSDYMTCVSRRPLPARGIPAPNSIRRSSSSGRMSPHRGSIPGRLFGETRKDEKMTPVAADLTDDDIRGLGAHIASWPGPPALTEADPDPVLAKAGTALVKDRHCAQCHLAVCRSGRNSAIGWAASANDRKKRCTIISTARAAGAATSSYRRSAIRWTRTTSNRSRISCRARARTRNRDRSADAPRRATGSVSRGRNA